MEDLIQEMTDEVTDVIMDLDPTLDYKDKRNKWEVYFTEKLKAQTANSRQAETLVKKAAPQACAATEEISKTLTKQQLSFKEKLIISLAGNDKYVLMKEIDRDRVKGIVYKDFDYEETAKTIIKQAEKIIEIMQA